MSESSKSTYSYVEKLKNNKLLNAIVWFFLYPFYQKTYGIPGLYALVCFFPQKILRINGNVPWLVHWTSRILYHKNIAIGNSSCPGLSGSNYIQARNGIVIGHNFRMGPNSCIISSNHVVDDYDEWTVANPIVIGDNVWVGSNVFIGEGVQIGDNVVIGAGSVVVKSIPANSIAVGAPCKVVKSKEAYRGKNYSEISRDVPHISFVKTAVYLSILLVIFKMEAFSINSLQIIQSPNFFYLSIFILYGSFLIDSIAWHMILKINKFDVGFRQSMLSASLTVFTKYIPGKIVALISRGAMIAKAVGKPTKSLFSYVLAYQVMIIAVGILLSLVYVFYNIEMEQLTLLAVLGVTLLLMGASTVYLSNQGSYSLKSLLSAASLAPLAMIIIFWVSISISFYFLLLSVNPDADIYDGFMFPVAITAGFLAIIAPGGLGVREGSLAYILTVSGYSLEAAIAISVISRLLFVIAETLFFTTGIIVKKTGK